MALMVFSPSHWVLPIIDGVLDPDEQVEEMSDFTMPDPKGSVFAVHRLLVLTNRNLRILGGKKQFAVWAKAKKASPLTSSATIPVHEIRGLAIGFENTATALEVRWTGGVEAWKSSFDTGRALAKRLEERLARNSASQAGSGMSDELARLAELVSQGVITQDDFERGKDVFLGRPRDAKAESIQLLHQLHGLYQSGVLSESEFNMKKWDVLSRSR